MASKSKIQKAVKIILMAAGADKVIAKADGNFFEAKASFFYRSNRSAEKWGKQVEAASQWVAVTDTREDYRNWPTTSYFVAVVEVLSPERLVEQAEALAKECDMTLDEAYKDMVDARS